MGYFPGQADTRSRPRQINVARWAQGCSQLATTAFHGLVNIASFDFWGNLLRSSSGLRFRPEINNFRGSQNAGHAPVPRR